ncbi:3-oxoacyl-ACP reductase FabG [Lyngbya confervoides]|uniref:3-oxoacyl-ACP reductase FabG n=1 Tax=Lyngbya confervoides BDU141951 TaxID=1574623 RepID=A0ABD4T8G4_9CYAN|nr:3-oxoacyl-ACP reductase FabG [Lyngbya confervoides]MCM1984795.1 3-oxoacyl-ACP reductase FabG [Lyngbya confervoides BDU141951]
MRNRHVLLTGGSGGLGQGVTPLLLAQGALITLPYINQTEVDQLRQLLAPAELARIRFVEADLSHEGQVQQLVDSMSHLDVLVHLVGGFSMGSTTEYGLDQWHANLQINLTTTFLLCKHSLRRMQSHGYGRIVTVGSGAAQSPPAQMAAYSAAKAGVVAFTQAIAAETKGTNITANTVLPSVIDTAANREALGQAQADQWVTPQSLGQVICFLASEAARDIRGAAVPVFGNV